MSVKEQDLKIEPDETNKDSIDTLIDGVAGLIADEEEAELYRLQQLTQDELPQYQQFLEDGLNNEFAFQRILDDRKVDFVESEPEPIDNVIKRKLTAVHYLRQAALAINAELSAKKIAFEAENAELFTDARKAKIDIENAENELRLLAIETYKNPTHDKTDKKPFPGVGIQIKKPTTIKYDPGKAFEWAKQKDICLSLDATAFEAICLTPSKPDFVSVHTDEVPTGTIDKDLSKALTALKIEIADQTDDLPEAS